MTRTTLPNPLAPIGVSGCVKPAAVPSNFNRLAAWLIYGLVVCTLLVGIAPAQQSALKRLDSAAAILQETLDAPDQAIPQDLLDHAECVGIFPSVFKGAFIIGGRYGKGVVSCRSGNGWSAPATFRIEGGNIGFQIGGSSTDIVLLFMGERSIERLLRTKVTLGIDGSAAAGPVGRTASGQTDALFGAEILTYSRARGLFAGIALDGATLRPARGANQHLYGSDLATTDILRGGVPAPDAARGLLEALKFYSPRKVSGD
jgi:lipid-binding SYLF domain-containing protein